MAEEDEYVAGTIATIGSLISKPKMTEKYLKKPPFRLGPSFFDANANRPCFPHFTDLLHVTRFGGSFTTSLWK